MSDTLREPKKRGPKPKAKNKRIRSVGLSINQIDQDYIERKARELDISTSAFIRLLISKDRDISESESIKTAI